MKILFDPIVTAEPNRCSTNIQFVTLAERLLKETKDVFIYWMVPQWVTAEQLTAQYPQDPRIEYIRYPQSKDRTREYLTLNSTLDKVLAFNGSHWDFDILLTVRSGLVPLMKLLMNSPRNARTAWLKKVWLIEEMPLMEFKKTVVTLVPDVQDLFTTAGYLAADRAYVLSYHEPKEIADRARDFFAPSKVMEIRKKLKPVCTTQFNEVEQKTEGKWFKKGEQVFCIGHAGRMEFANKIDEINDLMVKQFVMKGDKVRNLVCTQSRVVKEFDQTLIEVVQPNREQFWEYMRNDMHVMVMMPTEGGFVLSLVESLMLGLPVILGRQKWSEALLGADYPFMVKSMSQAYAFCQMFYDDYPTMYAQFAKWQEEVFVPLFQKRFETDLLYDILLDELRVLEQETPGKYAQKYPGKAENDVIQQVMKHVGDAKEMVMPEVFQALVDNGTFSIFARHLEEGRRDARNLAFSMAFNDFRIALKAFHGWRDASTKLGHLIRP